MPLKSEKFLNGVIESIRLYQAQELLSDRELSEKAGLSPSMVSKIKNKSTVPKMSTIRKLRDAGVPVGKVTKRMEESLMSHSQLQIGKAREKTREADRSS